MNQVNSRTAPDPGRYPTADEMPEIQAEKAKGEMGEQPDSEMNPVLDALQVLQQYVATAEQRGDPGAEFLKSHLVEFVKTMAGGQGQGAEAPESPVPPEGEEGMPAPEESEEPQEPQAEGQEDVPEETEMGPEQEEQSMPMKKRKLNQRFGQATPMV
jgi:hypothetical protein